MPSPSCLTTNIWLPMQAVQKPDWRRGRKSLGQGLWRGGRWRKGGGKSDLWDWPGKKSRTAEREVGLYYTKQRLDLTERGDCEIVKKKEHSVATLNLDQTGEWRKGKTEATFGIGIQKENGLTKSSMLKEAWKWQTSRRTNNSKRVRELGNETKSWWERKTNKSAEQGQDCRI